MSGGNSAPSWSVRKAAQLRVERRLIVRAHRLLPALETIAGAAAVRSSGGAVRVGSCAAVRRRR